MRDVPSSTKLFIFGQGHVGTHVRDLLPPEVLVGGTKRVLSSAENIVNLTDSGLTHLLEKATHLLVTVPPVEGKDVVLAAHHLLLEQQKNLKWIGYISSTSVYGNHDGAIVTEESPCYATSDEGKARLEAEKEWQDLAQQMGLALTIFRLGGIYGPHQNPLLRLKSGNAQKIIAPGHVFSRIHLADIGQVLLKALTHPAPAGIFNVVDDLPASQEEVYDYSAHLLGRPPLPSTPLEDALVSPIMRYYFQERKRVSNEKLKAHFQIKLYYPTYKEGLNNLYSSL